MVEDEESVRRLIAQSLRSLGYAVLEAANGQEAMTVWQKYGAQIELVLTDMVMPEGMTGLELIERLQRLKPGLRAIVASGYSTEITQTGLLTKAGIIYLPKPFDAQVLAKVVGSCFASKAATRLVASPARASSGS